jgi:hypothetical protein
VRVAQSAPARRQNVLLDRANLVQPAARPEHLGQVEHRGQGFGVLDAALAAQRLAAGFHLGQAPRSGLAQPVLHSPQPAARAARCLDLATIGPVCLADRRRESAHDTGATSGAVPRVLPSPEAAIRKKG